MLAALSTIKNYICSIRNYKHFDRLDLFLPGLDISENRSLFTRYYLSGFFYHIFLKFNFSINLLWYMVCIHRVKLYKKYWGISHFMITHKPAFCLIYGLENRWKNWRGEVVSDSCAKEIFLHWKQGTKAETFKLRIDQLYHKKNDEDAKHLNPGTNIYSGQNFTMLF